MGNHQAHQLHFSDPKAARKDPGPNINANDLRPIPYIGSINNTTAFGFGRYAGLTAKFERRFTNGLQYLTSYIWGHALATSGTTPTGTQAGTERKMQFALRFMF